MASIKVPPLGESIVEATVSRWLRQAGDVVTIGDTLVELETDKITVEVSALESGVLASHSHREGDIVTVGATLGEISAGVVQAADVATKPATAVPVHAAPLLDGAAVAAKVSPAAQRLGIEAALDVRALAGTGRGGVVSKADVIGAMASAAPMAASVDALRPARPPVAPTSPSALSGPAGDTRETREKMSTRRKRIAENLLLSQHQTAHLTTFNEIDMSAISALRERMKDRVEKEHGVKLSFMPFFVKAACHALAAYPSVNAQIDGETIVYKHYVNMGIAVASDAGLVVPNVKDADRKNVLDIGREITAVAKRARDGKLTMDDLTGGTFTITNGGVFGSLVSTPIINYPQVGILGLHKTQDRPIAIDGKVEIRPMMYVALSYDHRMIDGQQAVLFLVRFKELMEDPAAMLLA